MPRPPKDSLAEINGVKPDVLLQDGEEKPVMSKTTGSTVYKVKRTQDHYHCTCPAWRNQKTPVNARTCKHLQSLLGEDYEAARVKLKSACDGDEEDEADKKPAAKKARQAPPAPTSKSKPSSRAKGKAKAIKEEDEEQEDGGDDNDDGGVKAEAAADVDMADGVDDDEEQEQEEEEADDLAEINGVKPKLYLKDGDEKEVKSASSNSMYKVKRTWDHYYWQVFPRASLGIEQGTPVNARTCKHLKALLGDAYETARLKFKNPHGPAPTAAKTKASKANGAKGKKKAAKGDDDDDDEEDADDAEDGDEDDTSTKKTVPELLLANKWDLETGVDPTGWWISEKLDGVRTYYDGKKFWSRLGNAFTPPQWFIDTLPTDVTLDGELFGGRQKFQDTVSIVKTINSPHWKGITFEVFDIPSKASLAFEKRLEILEEFFGESGSHKSDHVHIVEHEEARDKDHVLERLKEVEELGGEGLMLRKPGSTYEGTRSSTLLKVKTFYDAEALVTGYVPGKGRNVGVTGALKCKMASGKTFNVGTGLNDKQRKNPPKVGTIIVYRFQELTRDKVPRFPSYVGEAADKTEPKDADIPVTRIPGAQPADV
ncbi:hypothetical protein BKA70DRAFT_1119873 [Coprinopsis sp. MPI-PUGE-AT-0042]|nr:hypothetical protein BKA70DRAFT_1119873 [Coprinopsis sp. MPI-PUGE-AT-0042]